MHLEKNNSILISIPINLHKLIKLFENVEKECSYVSISSTLE